MLTLVSSSGCDWRHPVGHGPVDVPAHRPQVGVPEAEDVRGAPREGPAPHLTLGECCNKGKGATHISSYGYGTVQLSLQLIWSQA